MAITIQQQPKIHIPAYDPIVYVVSSDKTGQANFKYVADIDIVGATGTPFRKKVPPHPTLLSGFFDFQDYIKQWVNEDLNITEFGWARNKNSFVEFKVSFGEEYGLSSTGTTVYPNQTSGTTAFAWNGVIDFLPFQNYNPSTHVIQTGLTNSFLTNSPSEIKIRDNENAWLYLQTSGTSIVHQMSVTTYNSAGSIISTHEIKNNFFNAGTDKRDRFLRFGCGTKNINSIPAADFLSGAQPIITSSVDKYDLKVQNSAIANVSETKIFRINNDCTRFTTYRFHFLNRLGGFDSFTFIRKDKKLINIERKTFKKIYGTQTATGWSYAKTERLINQTHVNLKDSITVNSDWITDNEAIWLEDLLHSPVVYLDDATHGLVAVNIDASTYEIIESVDEKLFNIILTFNYSYQRYRQSY